MLYYMRLKEYNIQYMYVIVYSKYHIIYSFTFTGCLADATQED